MEKLLQSQIFNEYINLIEKISGDILYLDPPYNQRQYATNYHMLKTIAKYDNPIIHGKTGLREYQDQNFIVQE
jgi:adenine-specific DNA-methyltransferase